MTEIDDTTAEIDAGITPWGRMTIADDVNLPYLGHTQFTALVFAQGIPHTAQARWTSTASSLDAVLELARTTVRTPREQSALLDLEPVFGDRSFVLVTLRHGTVQVHIAAPEHKLVTEIEHWLHELLPALEATEACEVPVRFWTCGPHGASSVSRTIAVPPLRDIKANYPPAVRERIGRLASSAFRPGEGGQLILWYGPPGTGKTYALRAIGWEWRQWCELHYVIDPEIFFGQQADYMVEVLLEDDDLIGLEESDEEQPRKWRLLVLEDTGDLLSADARERSGQGLSRLLNLVDGIVGQGLRVLVLVTTNEPLGRLHPAVARPGRCAARIEFERFSAREAAAWLLTRGGSPEEPGPATLADLFAYLHGYEREPEQSIGFGSSER